MTDNPNPGEQPEQNQPAPQEEPRLDPEQLRQFREFQRFQEYLRFTAANGSAQQGDEIQGNQIQPWTPPQVPVPAQETAPVPYRPAGPPDPPTPPTGNPQLHHQLAGMQQQLTELTEAQRKAERAANPPLWRKILRNKWLHRLVALIVLLLVGSWVLNATFGSDAKKTTQEKGPGTQQDKKAIWGTPTEAVHAVYKRAAELRADTDPRSAENTCFVSFSDRGGKAFATSFHQANCADTLHYLSRQVSKPKAYEAHAQIDNLVHYVGDRSTATTATMSACEMQVQGGPLLGEFTLTKDSNSLWQITDFQREYQPCPRTSSGPPESTEPTAPPS